MTRTIALAVLAAFLGLAWFVLAMPDLPRPPIGAFASMQPQEVFVPIEGRTYGWGGSRQGYGSISVKGVEVCRVRADHLLAGECPDVNVQEAFRAGNASFSGFMMVQAMRVLNEREMAR